MKILVECTFKIAVDVPDDPDYDMVFNIEENHCPGTGIVGAAFDKIYNESNKNNYCWACALQGKNKIL